MLRESMPFDVVIVGAGPAGLSSAIRLKQLAAENNTELSVCVVEKGAEVGAHLLSGAVFEPRALNELLPDWQELGAPLKTPVTSDKFMWLRNEKASISLPTPPQMHNTGNYIVSLGELAKWLAVQAEGLGVEIYAGFAASEVLYHENGTVKGIATGDMGVSKTGEHTENYAEGVELHAKQTIFSEGCRGSLTKTLIKNFNLDADCDPQTYALGIKEVWEITPENHQEGAVMHSIGWPLKNDTYGGSFVYHMSDNKIYIGFVVGLDYSNPTLSPFEEMQRFKHHDDIKKMLKGGKRISYGARTLVEGGIQSLPKLTFAGGMLAGDCAGTLNVAKIKGNHTAMKSGMIAAEAIFEHFKAGGTGEEVVAYDVNFKASWAYDELYKVRNIRPGFNKGLIKGLINAGYETYIGSNKTLCNHADHEQLKPLIKVTPITYPKPDGVISFDRLSSVFLSNTFHEENQPIHLKLEDESVAIDVNYKKFGSPETKYCPAGVYEIIEGDNGIVTLQINAANCLHCKACDIKDPEQNINWTVPEGSGGPQYSGM
ncbi:MAG: electron-transferring-flavoprotein dehydrogenase [Alphaproteobacteria bacterium]|jgi:electron-transferring-flavoprotein dehydrogenase